MVSNENILMYGVSNRSHRSTKNPTKHLIQKYETKECDLCNTEINNNQRNSFKSCTVSKIIDIPRRVIDGFMKNGYLDTHPQRGIILHTERYSWESGKEIYKNQNERLIAEENHMKKIKYLKKITDSRFKIQNQSLILEGENLFSNRQMDRSIPVSPLRSKRKQFLHHHSENIVKYKSSAPIIGDGVRCTGDYSNEMKLVPKVSVDIQKILLKNRHCFPDQEIISNAPTHGDSVSRNTNIPLQNSDGRSMLDKLPYITHSGVNSVTSRKQSDSYCNQDVKFESENQNIRKVHRPVKFINEYIMDGTSIKFTERSDIQSEIKYLKSIILPSIARELYVGRGINLPSNHRTKNPKKYMENGAAEIMTIKETKLEMEAANENKRSTNIENNNYIEIENTKNKFEDENEMTFITSGLDLNNSSLEDVLKGINKNVIKDEKQFMISKTVHDILIENPNIPQKWKHFVSLILSSIEFINMKQLRILFETESLSEFLQPNLFLLDIENARKIISPVFDLFLQSEDFLKMNDIIQLVGNANQLDVLPIQIKEMYDNFMCQICQEDSLNHEKIRKSHMLIFIPLLLQQLQN